MHRMNRLAFGLFLGAMGCVRGPETTQFSLPPHYTGTRFTSAVPEAEAAFGSWMVVGDIDGDAFPDVAISAPHETASLNPDAGAVYIFRGPSFIASEGTRITLPVSEGGPSLNDEFGTNRTGVAIGQIDGQGGEELVIGSANRDLFLGANVAYNDLGAVYVFQWDETTSTLVHAATLYPPHDDLANIPGGAGQHFGISVAVADVNNDSFGDIIVGADSSKRAYVYFGASDLTQISQTLSDTVTLLPPTATLEQPTLFGRSVASGNLDADGFAEVIVGEEQWWSKSEGAAIGRVTVFDGASLIPGSTIPSPLCGSTCYQVLQPPKPIPNAHYGEHLSVQDFSGDGVQDLSVFSELSLCHPGTASATNYLYQSSGTQQQWFGQIPDRALCGPDPGAYRFGRNTEVINWDDDGIPDLVVNEVIWDSPDGCGPESPCVEAGRVHIFLDPLSDGPSSPCTTFYSPEFLCYCSSNPTEGANFGAGLRVADLNLDGKDEILVGARHQPVNGLVHAGEVFLFGKP